MLESKGSLLRLAVVFVVALGSGVVRAEIASELEPDYAEATLAYNSKEYNRAITILNELQKKAPKTVEFLELKAITLKASKKEIEASKVYQELIQVLSKSGKEKKEIAPYAFELGVLNFNEKKYAQAEQYLSYSFRNGFNTDVSLFYLGMVSVQKQDWGVAESRLQRVLQSELNDIKPATHFYLAQTHFKNNSPSRGFDQLLKAKNLSESFQERADISAEGKQMASQIKGAADQALAPFDKSQWFANMTFTSGYDDNVLLVPTDTAGSQDISGKSTLKSSLGIGLGYASSPLRTLQWVPSARFNLNKNYNKDSSSGEFSDSTVSLYVTKDALAAFTYGLKTEGSVVFQNDRDAVTGSSTYRLFSTYTQLAPYTKWDFHRKWTLGAELGAKKLDFNGEEDVQTTFRRSGMVYTFKITGLNKRGKKYFNPSYTLKYEINDAAEGTEFKSSAYGAQVLNVMHLTHWEFTQILDFTRTLFSDSSADRKDANWVASLVATRKIGPRWGLIASGDYTINLSTVPASFKYNRYSMNAGVSYTF
jgi:tetratricopeptide (TPR) repeat protein